MLEIFNILICVHRYFPKFFHFLQPDLCCKCIYFPYRCRQCERSSYRSIFLFSIFTIIKVMINWFVFTLVNAIILCHFFLCYYKNFNEQTVIMFITKLILLCLCFHRQNSRISLLYYYCSLLQNRHG